MVMGYSASRMGRAPVGWSTVQGGTSTNAPVGVQGNFGVNVSGGASSGAGGLPGVLLVVAAGLVIFYVATRGVQGTRG